MAHTPIQQQLAQKVGTNFKAYLDRMATSAHFSTKQNIPPIVLSHGCKRVLDVGCADGSFTALISAANPQATVEGVDINPECIREAEAKWGSVNSSLTFTCGELAEVQGCYDCIIFSSVMHEISSYATNDLDRYTIYPIQDALRQAWERLVPGGIVIIRDFVDDTDGTGVHVKFKTKEVGQMFDRFIRERPQEMTQQLYNNVCTPIMTWDEAKGYTIADKFLMEFLMVATWGEASWDREILEAKFIATKTVWYEMARRQWFNVIGWLETNEEYPLFCNKLITATTDNGRWQLPNTTFIAILQKLK